MRELDARLSGEARRRRRPSTISWLAVETLRLQVPAYKRNGRRIENGRHVWSRWNPGNTLSSLVASLVS